MDWVEEQIVIAVPVTLEYDPRRVGKAELVAHAERGLTNALQHGAGYCRIEGGKAALLEQPTLTDRERFVLREVRDIYAAADDTIRGIGIVSVIDALLERTKEVASDDNTQGDAASAGSTQPALYAVMHGGAVMEYCRDEDEAAESARRFSGSVVPLYRHDRDADLLLKIGRREQRIEGR